MAFTSNIMKFFRYRKHVAYLEDRMQKLEAKIGDLENRLQNNNTWADRREELAHLIEIRIKEHENKVARKDSDACSECGYVPIAVRQHDGRGFRTTIRSCPICGAVSSEAKRDPESAAPI
jgi:hypothetical protein